MLTEKDIEQIEDHGLNINQIYGQLETFVRGIPFTQIVTTATVGNGIHQHSEKEHHRLEAFFEERKDRLDIVKFVPASGAATRMFSFLHEFLQNYNPEEQLFRDYVKRNDSLQLNTFFNSTRDFAFINEVRKQIRDAYPDYKQSAKGQRNYYFATAMLDEGGLNFANKPKGLIPFHKYNKYATTAFEEQLYEAAYYASVNDDVYLHFTFSEKHLPYFKEEFTKIKNRVSRKTKKTFHISYSFQKKETDTLAVTSENYPHRDEFKNLIFRPAGHGALLSNL
ncbi:MAG: DUF4301 family protein, partial [Flavobacteriaceae bacterium]|nr:DUF4301 family protein [Flavobacteriaceae bacterium]